MQDEKRRNEARIVAEEYAPRPASSPFMYGIVGVCIVALAMVIFGKSYDFDPLAFPIQASAVLMIAFVASLILWSVRSRQHDLAHRREYKKTELH